nr:26S proteasome non-ATPase regulatory subunit 4 homolog [Tanacetum cinerariifolium]
MGSNKKDKKVKKGSKKDEQMEDITEEVPVKALENAKEHKNQLQRLSEKLSTFSSIRVPESTVWHKQSYYCSTMVAPKEVIMICPDNTKWLRQGDDRLPFQTNAFQKLYTSITESNPNSLVGVSTLAGEAFGRAIRVLADHSLNHYRITRCFDDPYLYYVDRPINFKHGFMVADMASHDLVTYKDLTLRLLVFAGGYVYAHVAGDKEHLKRIGKIIKSHNIALDVINFGEEDEARKDKLEDLVAVVNNNGNSHIVHIPSTSEDDFSTLLSSPIFTGIAERQQEIGRREASARSLEDAIKSECWHSS